MSHQASVRLAAECELRSSREVRGACKSDPRFPSAPSPDFQPQAVILNHSASRTFSHYFMFSSLGCPDFPL